VQELNQLGRSARTPGVIVSLNIPVRIFTTELVKSNQNRPSIAAMDGSVPQR